MDPSWLMVSGLFSLFGFASFTYGRRQQMGVPTLVGVVLMVYPYFVSGMLALVAIGVLLIVALFVGSRMENG